VLLLGHGEFLGREVNRVSVPGFIITFRRSGSGRKDDKPHAHATPHLLLPLDPGYWSEAIGFDETWPSQLIYTPAGVSHRDSMARLGGRYLSISIEDTIIEHLAAQLRHPIAITRPLAARIANGIAWRTMSGELSGPYVEDACLALVGELSVSRAAPETTCPAWLRRLVDLCHSSVDSFPVISGMAATVGVHPVHAARVFRSHYGVSLSHYILWVKVQRAAAALRTGKTSAAMAAIENGFTDQSHLHRAFRAVLGTTPRSYQKLFRKNSSRSIDVLTTCRISARSCPTPRA
jgi:AraC family transcriptional regulator